MSSKFMKMSYLLIAFFLICVYISLFDAMERPQFKISSTKTEPSSTTEGRNVVSIPVAQAVNNYNLNYDLTGKWTVNIANSASDLEIIQSGDSIKGTMFEMNNTGYPDSIAGTLQPGGQVEFTRTRSYNGGTEQYIGVVSGTPGSLLSMQGNYWIAKMLPSEMGGTVLKTISTDRPGSDYRHFELGSFGLDQCVRECSDDPQCKAFTYVKPNYQGPKSQCYLKDSVPAEVTAECCISGIKVNYPRGSSSGRSGPLKFSLSKKAESDTNPK